MVVMSAIPHYKCQRQQSKHTHTHNSNNTIKQHTIRIAVDNSLNSVNLLAMLKVSPGVMPMNKPSSGVVIHSVSALSTSINTGIHVAAVSNDNTAVIYIRL